MAAQHGGGGGGTADDLENALLEQIFARVCGLSGDTRNSFGGGSCGSGGAPPAAYRHSRAVPQVCRRWRQVFEESTLLWEELCLDWATVQQQAVAYQGAAAWLVARLPYARRLVLSGCETLGGLQLQQVGAAAAAAGICLQCRCFSGCITTAFPSPSVPNEVVPWPAHSHPARLPDCSSSLAASAALACGRLDSWTPAVTLAAS
jgi:hypothetical protein